MDLFGRKRLRIAAVISEGNRILPCPFPVPLALPDMRLHLEIGLLTIDIRGDTQATRKNRLADCRVNFLLMLLGQNSGLHPHDLVGTSLMFYKVDFLDTPVATLTFGKSYEGGGSVIARGEIPDGDYRLVLSQVPPPRVQLFVAA